MVKIQQQRYFFFVKSILTELFVKLIFTKKIKGFCFVFC